jgi:4-diphosphocytidyl-2-C-methyl-D-erythritol kinase
MLSERRGDTVRVRAPAKVNLFLEVLAKRADGYHEIATLMVAVSHYDTLVFKEETSSKIYLACNRTDLSTGPENLVMRAATLLKARTGSKRGASIRLTKRIPMAAGLAGGSSDAAATLAGLDQLWKLGVPDSQLAEWSAELGSDVPFFLAAPAAWCTGRGEQVTPMTLARPLHFVLICPEVGLSTAAVYGAVKVPKMPATGREIRHAVGTGDIEEIGRRLHNRLQPVAEKLCPEIATQRRRLEALHPLGQLMSGSGTSLFALCRNRGEAQRLAEKLRHGVEQGNCPEIFVVRSCL